MSQETIRKFLNDEFDRRKSARPRYSYRAFAEFLSTDVSSLVQILKGKRTLTFEKAREFLNALQVPLDRRNALLLSLDDPSQYTVAREQQHLITIEDESHFRHWESFAALVCLDLPDVERTPEGIAARMGGDAEKVRLSLEQAARLGMIRFDGKHFLPTGENVSTSRLGNAALRENARQFINMGLERLLVDQSEEADFSGITLSCSKAKIPEAKRRIKEFRRSLAEFLSDEPIDEIIRINIQMFSIQPYEKRENKPISEET